MYLILIRHSESIKNLNKQFSSVDDSESLTDLGEKECYSIAKNIDKFLNKKHLSCNSIYSANSIRSINTATIISKQIGAQVQVEEDLRSTKPGTLAGKSEEEATKSNPEFIEQLYLFRNGLFNAYDFNVAGDKEPKKEFERRVLKCLDKILANEAEDIKILIAHRSSITCILLDFARKYYKYPTNFSGHVLLDLGRLSILEKLDHNKWKILKVNSESSELTIL